MQVARKGGARGGEIDERHRNSDKEEGRSREQGQEENGEEGGWDVAMEETKNKKQKGVTFPTNLLSPLSPPRSSNRLRSQKEETK
jgi:hypothetical protein